MSSIYIHDSGRRTCAKHAGEYLTASITATPDARYHQTPLGTWELLTAEEIAKYGDPRFDYCCEKCAKTEAA